jgi:hypothetical protein
MHLVIAGVSASTEIFHLLAHAGITVRSNSDRRVGYRLGSPTKQLPDSSRLRRSGTFKDLRACRNADCDDALRRIAPCRHKGRIKLRLEWPARLYSRPIGPNFSRTTTVDSVKRRFRSENYFRIAAATECSCHTCR